MSRYILAVDQSTQGTKGLLFDETGKLVGRADRSHRQLVNEKGWVSHDPLEILSNTLTVCRDVVIQTGIRKKDILAVAITNQRETTVAWNKKRGNPICDAIVWQCARASGICERHSAIAEMIRHRTGLTLSPYFPASKMGWIMENIPLARDLAVQGKLAFGTIDSFLAFSLCREHPHKTDFSNAGRTQLFDIINLCWDRELCEAFGIPMEALPEVCMSDACFGMTDLGGFLDTPIPVHGILGDSHGALLGQDCRKPGQIKATYGTGSSVMMNIGDRFRLSSRGLVTSLAWGLNGKVEYVFEGNLIYTGAVMTWLKNDVQLIRTDAEATDLAYTANPNDRTYFVPAFTGLGAPYWDKKASGTLTGITRTTGRAEIAKACLECIAYQIYDLTSLMSAEAEMALSELRVDGGPTASTYLMQFQSDLANLTVQIPNLQELSGLGAAIAAGVAVGLYGPETIYQQIRRKSYQPQMSPDIRQMLYAGWQDAVARTLTRK